ncbi:hypothetical protein ACE41H_07765 [Paenibacillus enshidis]|uniref:Uncharacterized protein n=1 Tax=Paenibacillus enshidis TaxID=1458439 RepID=A0ABV5ARP3_9BACL
MKVCKILFGTIFLLITLLSFSRLAFASDDYIKLEKRMESEGDQREWLTIKQSEAGFRIVSNDGKKEAVMVDNFGGIYLNGDLYLNNKKINDVLNESVTRNYVNTVVVVIISVLSILLLVLTFVLLKLKREINNLNNKFLKEIIKGE